MGEAVGPEHIRMVVGTKIDLPREVPREEAEAFAAECGAPYVETSVRTGEGIDKFARVLMEQLSRRGWVPPGLSWHPPGAWEWRSFAVSPPPPPSRPRPPPPPPPPPPRPEPVRLAAPARPSARSGDEYPTAALDELECVICFEAAADAFELSCCHKLVCGGCEPRVRRGGGCPHCRAGEWRLEAAVLARRLVASLPARCGWCGEGVPLGNLRAHEARCAAARVRCSVVGCDFEGLRSEFAEHVRIHG